LLPLSKEQKELLKALEAAEALKATMPALSVYLDGFEWLGTQESASRFDLSSGETDA
jgi:hypothetical protein